MRSRESYIMRNWTGLLASAGFAAEGRPTVRLRALPAPERRSGGGGGDHRPEAEGLCT